MRTWWVKVRRSSVEGPRGKISKLGARSGPRTMSAHLIPSRSDVLSSLCAYPSNCPLKYGCWMGLGQRVWWGCIIEWLGMFWRPTAALWRGIFKRPKILWASRFFFPKTLPLTMNFTRAVTTSTRWSFDKCDPWSSQSSDKSCSHCFIFYEMNNRLSTALLFL